jgi:hypothetical protein
MKDFTMKLHEEFKLYETMWEPNKNQKVETLKEAVDYVAALQTRGISGAP